MTVNSKIARFFGVLPSEVVRTNEVLLVGPLDKVGLGAFVLDRRSKVRATFAMLLFVGSVLLSFFWTGNPRPIASKDPPEKMSEGCFCPLLPNGQPAPVIKMPCFCLYYCP